MFPVRRRRTPANRVRHCARCAVIDAAYSPDGSTIATIGTDDQIRLWDAATGAPGPTLAGHRGEVLGVAFSADGARVVSYGADGTARLWDTRSGRPSAPPLAHATWVLAAAFSPDAARVVTASGARATLWDARTGRALGPPLELAQAATGVAFTPSGSEVVVAGAGLRVWDAALADGSLADWQRQLRLNPLAAIVSAPDAAVAAPP